MISRREHLSKARQLQREATEALQPLYDELAITDTFDGVTLFAMDGRRERQAVAAVGLRPDAEDSVRHDFHDRAIAGRMVDLGATALGLAFEQDSPEYLRSRMNPDKHTTWAEPVIIDGKIAGGAQAAFRYDRGALMADKAMRQLWQRHTGTIEEMAHGFSQLSKDVGSLGDVLEYKLPVTPNAYVVGWDLNGSSKLALRETTQGALASYLSDAKRLFGETVREQGVFDYDDTGDGQHFVLWLPGEVDRADPEAVHDYLQTDIEPLVRRMQLQHEALRAYYPDIDPTVRFAIGVGSADRDEYASTMTPALWEIAEALNQDADGSMMVAETRTLRALRKQVKE